MVVTSAEGRQTARLFWAVILPSYNPVPRCGSWGAGDVPGADYCYLPPPGAATDANAADGGGRGPPGGTAGGDHRWG